jgi:short-subunit dehydrogenase
MTDLAGKTVWITGASSGIGEALALDASRRGARLVLSARRETELERVRQACARPHEVALLPVDLAALEDADALASRAAACFGPIDVLVNNAGISQRTALLDTDMAAYRRLFEIDLFAPIALTRALAPGWVARGRGHVVVVSSVFGHIAMARRTGYAAAKHALHGFFDSARIELEPRGVRFTLACPGFVRTNISVNALGPGGQPFGRSDHDIDAGMAPETCARKILDAVEADRLEVTIAGIERVAVWIKRYLPLRWYTAFARRLNVN